MAYTIGDPILDDEYNVFATGNAAFGVSDPNTANVNAVWGVGFGNKGYGQSTELTPVQNGETVTATQWQTLIDRILTSDDHQGVGGLGDMPGDLGAGGAALTTGDTVEIINTLSANITQIYTNRLTSIATATNTPQAAAASASWDVSSVHTIAVEFTSGDEMRYFFNCGGNIEISATRTGGGSGEDNAAWDTLLSDINIVRFGAEGTTKIGGGGTGTTIIETTIGYFDMTTSPVQVFRQYGGTAYANDNLQVTCQSNGTQGVNGDEGDILTFVTTLEVGAPPTASPAVDGTTTVTATVNFPETTYLTETWNSGGVTFPTVSVVQS